MDTQELFASITQISKANAYDIVREENRELRHTRDELLSAIAWLIAEPTNVRALENAKGALKTAQVRI